MPFKKGNNLNPAGGKPGNKGGGRPPDWLKAKCQNIVDKRNLYEWLGEVAAGDLVEQKVVFDNKNKPKKVKCPAEIRDRIKAIEMLSDRGYGKALQSIEHSGQIDVDVDKHRNEILEALNCQ